jgi:hypothetical protein
MLTKRTRETYAGYAKFFQRQAQEYYATAMAEKKPFYQRMGAITARRAMMYARRLIYDGTRNDPWPD